MPYLSVIIPTYNEAERLPSTLEIVRDYLSAQPYDSEVLIIDDGSTDRTVEAALALRTTFTRVVLTVQENAVNCGKGAVVRQGMLAATGQYRLFADADNSTPISQLDRLLQWVPEYPVVIGSRYLESGSIKDRQPWQRRLLSRAGNLVIRALLLPGIRDTQCGFKLFSREAAEAIFHEQRMRGWAFDVEVLTLARQLGFAIKEVPVEWHDSPHSKLRATRAAIRSLRDVWRVYRQVKRRPVPRPRQTARSRSARR
jgi:dolichyl-phosphate beta-glucosyltransferase